MAEIRINPVGYEKPSPNRLYDGNEFDLLLDPFYRAALQTQLRMHGNRLLAAPDDRAQGPGSLLHARNRLLGTAPGEERFQMWPERMIRSATTLPGDVLTGQQQLESRAAFPGAVMPGTQDVQYEGGRSIPGSHSGIGRVQDLSNLAMSGSIPAVAMRGAATDTLGAGFVPKVIQGGTEKSKQVRYKKVPYGSTVDRLPEVARRTSDWFIDEFGKGKNKRYYAKDNETLINDDLPLRVEEFKTRKEAEDYIKQQQALDAQQGVTQGQTWDFPYELFKPVSGYGPPELMNKKTFNRQDPRWQHVWDRAARDTKTVEREFREDTGYTGPVNVEFVEFDANNPSHSNAVFHITPVKGTKLRSGLGDEGGMPATAPLGQLAVRDKPVFNQQTLPKDLQTFIELSRSLEQKHGADWLTKLSPAELSTLKETPALRGALANIERAKSAGLFEKALQKVETTRRGFFGQAAGMASAVSNASKLAKMFEATEVVAAPSPMQTALDVLRGSPARYDQLNKDILKQRWDALENIASKYGVNRVEDLVRNPNRVPYDIPEAAKQEVRTVERQWHDQQESLRPQWEKERDKLIKDLDLPVLNREQQNVMRSLVTRSLTETGFSWDAGKLPSLNSMNVRSMVTPGHTWNKGFEEAVNKLTLQQNKEVADHLRPVIMQSEDLTLGEMRNLVRLFPSLKGTTLFSGVGNEGKLPATAPLGQIAKTREPAPVFYSGVENALDSTAQAIATPDQWLGPRVERKYVQKDKNTGKEKEVTEVSYSGIIGGLKGVKPEEIEWLGIPEFLAEKKAAGQKVTRAELQDFVKTNKVEVKEINKKSTGDDLQDVGFSERQIERAEDQAGQELYSEFENGPQQRRAMYNDDFNDFMESRAGQQRLQELTEEFLADVEPESLGATKFSEYQLPGGTDYGELLLTMPQGPKPGTELSKQVNQIFKRVSDGRIGVEHWGSGFDPIQVARQWVKEGRMTPEEFKIFEQYQHQLKESLPKYHSSHWDEPNVLAHVRYNTRYIDVPSQHPTNEPFTKAKTLFLEEIQSDWHQAGKKKGYKGEKSRLSEAELQESRDLHAREIQGEKLTDAEKRRLQEIQDAHQRSLSDVPDAPFKKSWPELAFKRMLRYAADNGYDAIAWTPGEVQASRYDLSKQLDGLKVRANEDGTFNLDAKKKGDTLYTERLASGIEHDKLPDYIGKDLAEKIRNQEETEKVYSGLDLKVGGEGMMRFYDDQLPVIAGKYGKAHGTKVEQKALQSGLEINPTGKDGKSFLVDDPNNPDFTARVFHTKKEVDDFVRQHSPSVHFMRLPESLRDQAVHRGYPLFSSGLMLTPVEGNPFDTGKDK